MVILDAFKTDFTVSNHGSIYLLELRTDAAVAWAEEHLPEDAYTFGRAVVVAHRYVRDIVAGATSDGLVVE